MRAGVRMTIALCVVMITSRPLLAQAPDALTRLEAEAVRALAQETAPFSERAELVERLQAARAQAQQPEQGARLSLYWLQSLRWLLAAVPFGDSTREPYRQWLANHDLLVIYSEPAGEWLVMPDVPWEVHDAYRMSGGADDIAWFAVTNGYPGECEGYVPCHANILNRLDGEYLRRHPQGRHVVEALDRLRSTFEALLKLMGPTPATDMLNPATDCGDLRSGLEPLRDVLKQSRARDASGVLAPVDRLLAYCR